MSRGNYYYAKGWISGKTNGWTNGERGRFNALEDGFIQSITLFILGVIIQAFSTFEDVSMFSAAVPLLSFIFGLTGAIATLEVSKKGWLYVSGWTFISVVLFVYNIIKVDVLLVDLIPIAVLIVYAIVRSGLLDNVLTIRYRD